MTTRGVPFNGTYIAESRPHRAVPDVSDDPNIMDRLYRYAAGVRRELEPEAKLIHRATKDMIRYYTDKLKKLEKCRDYDAADKGLDRHYATELGSERQYLDTLARFFDWMGTTRPRS